MIKEEVIDMILGCMRIEEMATKIPISGKESMITTSKGTTEKKVRSMKMMRFGIEKV